MNFVCQMSRMTSATHPASSRRRLNPWRVAALTSWSRTWRVAVDRLAADRRFEASACLVELDVESDVEPMPGLTPKDQLIEPQNQQVFGRFRRERDRFGFSDLDLVAIGHDHVEETRGGRSEQVRQVVADDSQSQVGGVVERLGAAHGSASVALGFKIRSRVRL